MLFRSPFQPCPLPPLLPSSHTHSPSSSTQPGQPPGPPSAQSPLCPLHNTDRWERRQNSGPDPSPTSYQAWDVDGPCDLDCGQKKGKTVSKWLPAWPSRQSERKRTVPLGPPGTSPFFQLRKTLPSIPKPFNVSARKVSPSVESLLKSVSELEIGRAHV